MALYCYRQFFGSFYCIPAPELGTLNIVINFQFRKIYLNAAEAGFKLGGDYAVKGLGYLNEIVSRANPNKSVSADEFTLERILKERRKELVGEGLALYDYTRNKLPVDRNETGGWHLNTISPDAVVIEYNDPRHAVPIPQTEVDANPNL